ncbi:hypothetical protein C6P40_000254 [Pichia californica]|uniref:Major facilitator superfamily (MFS) profile domain-containing protein n=1 Tax=Pichia californica TaxID=460514 RepID=A0A9P6WKU5_9ASCO|nr:hypothetical protein C6P40_000254 [[Candida] californica]
MINSISKIKEAYLWARNIVPMERRNVFVVYFFVLLATCLDNLNTATAFTLQANIQEVFKTDSSTASWVLSGYALTLGSFILVSGKISDIIGSHNFYLLGLLVLWICSLICACLPTTSIITLIVFRAFQGIGASALVPSTLALAANYFTGKYAKYLPAAVVSFIVALTGIFGIGMVLGGAFSETSIGYKSYFYFVFAYGLVINIILLFIIIPIEKTKEHENMKLKNIDFIGSALSIIGALLIILGLTEGGENWRKPKAYVPLIVGFFTFISSLLYERFYLKRFQQKNEHKDKSEDWRLQVELLYPPEIINIPNFLNLLIITGMYYSTFTMITAVGVQYYSLVEGDSPIIVAVKVLPFSIGLIFGALVYRPSYFNKLGLKRTFILSAIITLGTCIWFSRIDFRKNNSYWKFGFASMLLYGYGINMYFNIYIGVVVSNTPLHLQGVVNGIYQTCSQVLLSIGNALVPSIVGNIQLATTENAQLIIHNKLKTVLYVAMGFHVVILLIMIIFVKESKPKEEITAPISESDNIDIEKNVTNDQDLTNQQTNEKISDVCSEKEDEEHCNAICLGENESQSIDSMYEA